ncbi:hypothetical protein HZA56_14115 [Candidatus Poribacteria bacterium]|nr:hypothetical protein [Candidatus Poribacteria bacterium]
MADFQAISDDNEKMLAVTRKEIESLRQSVDSDIDIDSEITYTDEQIEKLLKKLPVVMYHAAEQIVLRLMEFKESKRRLKKTLSNEMMKARLDATLTAVGDRKAAAENSQAVEDAEIVLINAEAEYRMAEYRYDSYDNLYTAVKKLSAMRIEQNKAQERADR